MENYTFMAALQLAARHGEYITIGGGEPTTHKEFFAFLDKAIELYEAETLDYPPFLVTNGKLKGKAMKLLDYVEDERPLHVCLSQDSFHDPIDPAVVQRFRRHQERQDRRSYGSYGNENSSASIRRALEINRGAGQRRLASGRLTLTPNASVKMPSLTRKAGSSPAAANTRNSGGYGKTGYLKASTESSHIKAAKTLKARGYLKKQPDTRRQPGVTIESSKQQTGREQNEPTHHHRIRRTG